MLTITNLQPGSRVYAQYDNGTVRLKKEIPGTSVIITTPKNLFITVRVRKPGWEPIQITLWVGKQVTVFPIVQHKDQIYEKEASILNSPLKDVLKIGASKKKEEFCDVDYDVVNQTYCVSYGGNTYQFSKELFEEVVDSEFPETCKMPVKYIENLLSVSVPKNQPTAIQKLANQTADKIKEFWS